MELKIVNKELIKEFGLPNYGTVDSACLDFRTDQHFSLRPNQTILVGSGVALNILDRGIVLKLYPRSGMGSRGLVLGNLTGIIDSDYQGEIKLCLWNRTAEDISYSRGERVVQGMFQSVIRPYFLEVSEFSTKTERGSLGFGHTGSN